MAISQVIISGTSGADTEVAFAFQGFLARSPACTSFLVSPWDPPELRASADGGVSRTQKLSSPLLRIQRYCNRSKFSLKLRPLTEIFAFFFFLGNVCLPGHSSSFFLILSKLNVTGAANSESDFIGNLIEFVLPWSLGECTFKLLFLSTILSHWDFFP